MGSLLDKLYAGVSDKGAVIRPMGGSLLGAAEVRASAAGNPEADVEHLLSVLLNLIDLRRALDARGIHPADASAVVGQLLDERAVVDGAVIATRTPRLQAVFDLVMRDGGSSVTVITSVAGALPRELAFLQKPLEQAALDVAPLYDGALSSSGGAMSFQAWDGEVRACFGGMQRLVDTRWHAWTMLPLTLFITLLCAKRYHVALTARGVDVAALVDEMAADLGEDCITTYRDPPAGYVAALSPSLIAVVLRAEQSAAADACNVQLRHLLASLHAEPELAPWVERVAAVLAPPDRSRS